MNKAKFNKLTEKYGKYSSWAIWNDSDENDTGIIFNNIDKLKADAIIIGLNISKPLDSAWSNFRGGKHDRKLKYAFNHSSYRGVYMTDLFKNIIEPDSSKIERYLKNNTSIVENNILIFLEELKDVGATKNSIMIIMGSVNSLLIKYYKKYISHSYPRYLCNPHYSYFKMSDKEWTLSTWKNIQMVDYNFTHKPWSNIKK